MQNLRYELHTRGWQIVCAENKGLNIFPHRPENPVIKNWIRVWFLCTDIISELVRTPLHLFIILYKLFT